MKRLSNIDSLFLIDQFGTLHDGRMAYPVAAAALMRIRAAGRKVVLLSSSGRPLEPNANRLANLGIGPKAYDLLLTSGEVAARMSLPKGRFICTIVRLRNAANVTQSR
jgi:ribonucleotide monophosphatase NagD (HAD superfamily)